VPVPLGEQWRGKTQDPVISWAIIEEFSLEKLISKFQNHVPVIWAILWSFLNNDFNVTVNLDEEQAESEPGPDSETTLSYRPKEVVHTFSVSQ